MTPRVETHDTDILILGSGGAGLFAALHAHKANPDLKITVAVKGLLGKSGCTRMVQGGYNVALHKGDSVERHFMDTIEGGKWLNHQDLAWTLVNTAIDRVLELENDLGCFFDRNPDGSIHGKAFAGQTFDRTVHKGSLTGIEIINRLAEQVWARGVERLEEHRAVALIPAKDGSRIAGVLMIDMRRGGYLLVRAKAVMLGTGGGPSMYRYHTPSGDKSCDGMAMGLRLGLELRDMEMVQFHPTGLVAGADTRITGTIIEEGLRGAGGHVLDGTGERFMHDYDPRGERATRDIVSRAMFEQMRKGKVGPNGGLYITMRHLDPDMVKREFRGMVLRCENVGFDLVSGLVEVTPTAHYMMGGISFEPDATTALTGLFAAGEDTGGIHGANRLGGNGVANSTVFGGIAGDSMAAWVPRHGALAEPDPHAVDAGRALAEKPFAGKADPAALNAIREALYDGMWEDAGIIRSAGSLDKAEALLGDLSDALARAGVPDGDRAFNLTWHDWLNLDSLILTSRAVVAAARARTDSRGAHYREENPETGSLEASANTIVRLAGDRIETDTRNVAFTRVKPGETLLKEEGDVAAE